MHLLRWSSILRLARPANFASDDIFLTSVTSPSLYMNQLEELPRSRREKDHS
jgi:hypothetical protein